MSYYSTFIIIVISSISTGIMDDSICSRRSSIGCNNGSMSVGIISSKNISNIINNVSIVGCQSVS